jgi:hypothetical protein
MNDSCSPDGFIPLQPVWIDPFFDGGWKGLQDSLTFLTPLLSVAITQH